MNARPLVLAAALLALPAAARAAATTWDIDVAHSSVGFKVRHMVVTNVPGRFDRFSGSIVLDDADVSKSSVTVEIETASINTAVPDRDNHLKNADFFDAEKFPKMTFKSTKVEKGAAADKLKVTGDLTLKGVTKPVVLDVTRAGVVKDQRGNSKTGFSATARINRKDFGITYGGVLESGGLMIGEEIDVTLEIEANQKPAAAGAK